MIFDDEAIAINFLINHGWSRYGGKAAGVQSQYAWSHSLYRHMQVFTADNTAHDFCKKNYGKAYKKYSEELNR